MNCFIIPLRTREARPLFFGTRCTQSPPKEQDKSMRTESFRDISLWTDLFPSGAADEDDVIKLFPSDEEEDFGEQIYQ